MSNPAVKSGLWSYVLDQPTRLLIVDDDPILREFASVYLSTPTAIVETAANGEIALQLLRNGQFDIALLDIEMPVLDGFGLLEAIRADPKLRHLPVMMLTWHEDIACIDRAHVLGANAFVTKPVNWRLLSYHIRYVLRACRIEGDLGLERDRALARELSGSKSAAQEYRDALISILQKAKECPTDCDGLSAQQLLVKIQHIAALADATLTRSADSASDSFDSALDIAPDAGATILHSLTTTACA